MPRHTAVTAAYRRAIRFRGGLTALAAVLLAGPAVAQAPGLGLGAELVDPHVLRVCADPSDLPFSNQAQEGFENRIAALLAQELGKQLGFTWQPQVFGFLRLTLDDYRCDVVMGITQGNHEVANSNAYYRSVYALIYRQHNGFDGLQSLEDPAAEGQADRHHRGHAAGDDSGRERSAGSRPRLPALGKSALLRAGAGHDRGSGE